MSTGLWHYTAKNEVVQSADMYIVRQRTFAPKTSDMLHDSSEKKSPSFYAHVTWRKAGSTRYRLGKLGVGTMMLRKVKRSCTYHTASGRL